MIDSETLIIDLCNENNISFNNEFMNADISQFEVDKCQRKLGNESQLELMRFLVNNFSGYCFHF